MFCRESVHAARCVAVVYPGRGADVYDVSFGGSRFVRCCGTTLCRLIEDESVCVVTFYGVRDVYVCCARRCFSLLGSSFDGGAYVRGVLGCYDIGCDFLGDVGYRVGLSKFDDGGLLLGDVSVDEMSAVPAYVGSCFSHGESGCGPEVLKLRCLYDRLCVGRGTVRLGSSRPWVPSWTGRSSVGGLRSLGVVFRDWGECRPDQSWMRGATRPDLYDGSVDELMSFIV